MFIIAVLIFAWWAQRDAYRMGIEQGRADMKLEMLKKEMVDKKIHLQIVR